MQIFYGSAGNNDLAAIFETKFTFKYQPLSVVFDLKIYELIAWFSYSIFVQGEIAWENCIKTVYDIYNCWTS